MIQLDDKLIDLWIKEWRLAGVNLHRYGGRVWVRMAPFFVVSVLEKRGWSWSSHGEETSLEDALENASEYIRRRS